MLKEKGGSAKIKQAIFHIAPAPPPPPPPPLSINNDRSLNALNRQLGIRRFIADKGEKYGKAKQAASKLRLALVSGMKYNLIFKDSLNERLQEANDRK